MSLSLFEKRRFFDGRKATLVSAPVLRPAKGITGGFSHPHPALSPVGERVQRTVIPFAVLSDICGPHYPHRRRNVYYVACASLLVMTTFVTSTPAKPILPYPVQREVLPNGLTVIMIPMPSPGLISYYSVVRTGSRDEVEPGRTGYAHFFEHMMFRGTKTYPGADYDRIVTGIGSRCQRVHHRRPHCLSPHVRQRGSGNRRQDRERPVPEPLL